jgi:hypothetical protein
MRSEQRALNQFLENITAQDVATQFQAHEAAQGRRLQAAGLGIGSTTSLLQLLGQAEQSRRGLNLQAVATAGGVPLPAPTQFGQPLIDIGQLLLLRQLVNQPAPAPAAA